MDDNFSFDPDKVCVGVTLGVRVNVKFSPHGSFDVNICVDITSTFCVEITLTFCVDILCRNVPQLFSPLRSLKHLREDLPYFWVLHARDPGSFTSLGGFSVPFS